MVNGPAPAALPITPSTVNVLPAVAAKPPPGLLSQTNRAEAALPLSKEKVLLAASVPPSRFTVAAVDAAPRDPLPVISVTPPFR